MPTPEDVLLSNSTLSTGTPWEHLNAQAGGIGGTGVVLLDGLEIEMDDRCVDVEVDLEEARLNEEALEYEVEVEPFDYEIEVC